MLVNRTYIIMGFYWNPDDQTIVIEPPVTVVTESRITAFSLYRGYIWRKELNQWLDYNNPNQEDETNLENFGCFKPEDESVYEMPEDCEMKDQIEGYYIKIFDIDEMNEINFKSK